MKVMQASARIVLTVAVAFLVLVAIFGSIYNAAPDSVLIWDLIPTLAGVLFTVLMVMVINRFRKTPKGLQDAPPPVE